MASRPSSRPLSASQPLSRPLPAGLSTSGRPLLKPRTITELDAVRTQPPFQEVLHWASGCFTQRHVATDVERQQAAVKRVARMMGRVEPQDLRPLVDFLKLILDSMADEGRGADLTAPLCGLVEAIQGMPTMRFIGRWAQFGDDIGALAGVIAPLLESADSSLEQAAFDALFTLISNVRKDDHRADPPPRTPTPSSVMAVERPAVLNAVVNELAQSSDLLRQSHACELLLLLCRSSAPACALASEAGAERAILRMLQYAGNASTGPSSGAVRGPTSSMMEATESSPVGDEMASKVGAPSRSDGVRKASLDTILVENDMPLERTRPYSAGQALRAQLGLNDSDDEVDSPPDTPPSRQRRVQSAAPRSSAPLSTVQSEIPALSTKALLGGSTQQLAAGERGRLIFRCVELLSILLDDGPESTVPQIASVEGTAALLPIVQATLRAADTKDGKRLKNDVLLLLNQIANTASGPRALAHGGILGVLANGVLASLTPELAAIGVVSNRLAIKLCSGFAVDDFESVTMALSIFRRCVAASSACAAAVVASRLDEGMCKLLSPEAWTTSWKLCGWKSDQRAKLRVAALEILREIVRYSDAQLGDGRSEGETIGSPRLQSAAELLMLCADEAAASAMGEPAPLLCGSIEALAAIAADPSGAGAGAERLRSLGAVLVLSQIVGAERGVITNTIAGGLALHALGALSEVDSTAALEVLDQGLVPLILNSLGPIADGNMSGSALLRPGTDAWAMLQRLELLASLSITDDARVLETLIAQVADAAGVYLVVEMLCVWPPALLWSGLSLLAEWTSQPEVLADLMSMNVALPTSCSIWQSDDPSTLPALSVLLRLWAATEQSLSLGPLCAPGESRATDAVAPRPNKPDAKHLLGLTTREDERPSDVLGKLYALIIRADRMDVTLPQMSPRDETLLTAARAYASVKEGRAWAKLATSLNEEGLQPVAADVKRMDEAIEASGRAVDTSWASQREQWNTIRDAAQQTERATYEDAVGRVSVMRMPTRAERTRVAPAAHGQRDFDQRRRGKAIKESVLARPSLVVPEGGWVIEDEWRTDETKAWDDEQTPIAREDGGVRRT